MAITLTDEVALRRVEEELLHDQAWHCVQRAIDSGDKTQQRKKIAERVETLSRSSR